MARPKIGTAKYGGNKKKYWKLKDGEMVFRILPPLGELAEDGKWSVFYSVHYGYRNDKNQTRAFQSSLVKNRKNNMIEVPDAALERIDKLKAELEKAKKAGDKKAQETLLKLVGGPKSIYNCDNNHYLNVIDTQGNVGILKLRHRAKLALDMTIKELRDKGVDPLSVDNGRFFVFSRSGNALETTFKVTIFKRKLNVEGVGEVEQDVVHKLTDDIIDRLGSEAAELNKLFKKPSAEEVAQIVKDSVLTTGVSSSIDSVLGYDSNEASDDDSAAEAEEAAAAEETATTTTAAPTQTAAPAQKVETKTEVKEEKKEAPKAASVSSPQTTAQAVADMTDADFLKILGVN